MGALLMTDAPDELLSLKQVAQVLGLSRPTVYRLLREGVLQPVTPDNPFLDQQRRKFRRADIERLKRQMRGEEPNDN